MKKIRIFIALLLAVFFPLSVNAAGSNTPVGTGLNKNVCTSSPYQDDIISTNSKAYFSHCVKATCSSRRYNLEYYYDNLKVNCTNGNTNPYKVVYRDGCSDYINTSCSNNDIKYCSRVVYYDCSRKSNGSSFATTTKSTTTKTTTTTTKTTSTTTTSTTTSVVAKDSRLQSLSLSNGSISFNPDVYEYKIIIESSINNLNISAVPMDSTSEVSIDGNTNLVNGSVITITVKTTDDKLSTYKINIEKKEEVILSNNSKLLSLSVSDYSLAFNSNINNYSLIIDADVDSLIINYEVADEKSNVSITGNENLENGSVITITVTAEDGSVSDYTIDIIVKKKSNFLSILFIIIVILALGAGGFYVYKKFFASKSGEKYEYE